MDKQEAAKELYRRKIQAENRYLPNEWSKGHQNGLCEGLQDAIKIIEQIDEPEKPTVPKFVADWYENNKRDFENQIYALCISFYDDALSEKLHHWFVNSENEPIQTLVRMKFYDYEIEKEKLYEVFLKRTKVQLSVITPDYKDKYQFTDEELKEYGFDNTDVYEVKEVEE